MQAATKQRVEDSPAIREKVMAARMVALKRWPYFGPQLLCMVLVGKPGIGTCSTDCKGRLDYDPEFVENISVEALATVILHEVLHNWLDHANRRQGRSPKKWNMSVDREINDDLAGESMPFPEMYPPLLPEQIGQPNGQLGEFYFEHEEEDGGEDEGDDSGDGDSGDEGEDTGPGNRPSGSSSDGIPRPWEDGPEDESGVPEIPDSQQECIRQQVSENIIEAHKNRGIYGDVIMPACRRPIPSTAIVLDTSGSMYGDDLDTALSETQGVLKALGGREVRVLATDAAVHSKQKVTKASKIQVLGGGGTDLRVGITEAAKLKPPIDLCIVLTDGYTPWPDKAPKGMRVVIAIIGKCSVAPPKWARTITIE